MFLFVLSRFPRKKRKTLLCLVCVAYEKVWGGIVCVTSCNTPTAVHPSLCCPYFSKIFVLRSLKLSTIIMWVSVGFFVCFCIWLLWLLVYGRWQNHGPLHLSATVLACSVHLLFCKCCCYPVGKHGSASWLFFSQRTLPYFSLTQFRMRDGLLFCTWLGDANWSVVYPWDWYWFVLYMIWGC